MATYHSFIDAAGATKYIKIVSGDGSTGDPYQALAHTGATDDAAAAGQIYPVAGLYQTTIDEVDAGDVGRVRMSARRGIVTTPDFKNLAFSSTTPDPTGSDAYVTLGASDFAVRDTSIHYLHLPLGAGGWTNTFIAIQSTLDQSVTLFLRVNGDIGSYNYQAEATALQATLPSNVFCCISSSGAVGQGGVSGGATAVNDAYYSVPAMQYAPRLAFGWLASVAPTTGGLFIKVNRVTR